MYYEILTFDLSFSPAETSFWVQTTDGEDQDVVCFILYVQANEASLSKSTVKLRHVW